MKGNPADMRMAVSLCLYIGTFIGRFHTFHLCPTHFQYYRPSLDAVYLKDRTRYIKSLFLSLKTLKILIGTTPLTAKGVITEVGKHNSGNRC